MSESLTEASPKKKTAAKAAKKSVAKKAPAKKVAAKKSATAAKKVAQAATPEFVFEAPVPAPAPVVEAVAAPKKVAAKKAPAKKAAKAAKSVPTPVIEAPVVPPTPPQVQAAPKTEPTPPPAPILVGGEEPAGVSALLKPRRSRKVASSAAAETIVSSPAPEPAAASEAPKPEPVQAAPEPIGEGPRQPRPAYQKNNREERREISGRTDELPAEDGAPVRADGQSSPQADGSRPPFEDKKNFRKSWKQRKFEKYLKRKQEREERLREQGIDPATVQAGPRPQHPNQQHPNQQQPHPHAHQNRPDRERERVDRFAGERPERPERGDRNERPSERDWEAEKDRRPEPQGPAEPCAGLLEISPKGFGFIRLKEKNYAQSPTDTFVTPEMVRKYGLRDGVWMEGEFKRGFRGPQMTELKTVNALPPDHYRQLPIFEELTAINPTKRYTLETDGTRFTTRLVDMVAPIGRGQRGLIVAAPRAGKTTFLEHMAQAMLKNYPEVKLLVLLVDERPEEVTELTRALPGAEIMASSNDQDPRAHVRMAQLAIERAKRLVEAGEHVFMLMDSITRLARAFNQAMVGGKGGGKAMSGGIDSRALEMPRKIFAAARNTREAGSLTIIATALIETNNRGDDLIFQEFKGTGNMELVLDRKIAQQYIYPAVDIFKSGTRREELLLPPYQLEKINIIRRGLAGHKPNEAVERLIFFLNRFKNNNELLTSIGTKNG